MKPKIYLEHKEIGKVLGLRVDPQECLMHFTIEGWIDPIKNKPQTLRLGEHPLQLGIQQGSTINYFYGRVISQTITHKEGSKSSHITFHYRRNDHPAMEWSAQSTNTSKIEALFI